MECPIQGFSLNVNNDDYADIVTSTLLINQGVSLMAGRLFIRHKSIAATVVAAVTAATLATVAGGSAPASALSSSMVPRLVAGGGMMAHGADNSYAACPTGVGTCGGQPDGRTTFPIGVAVHPVSKEVFFSQGSWESNSELSNNFYKSIRRIKPDGKLQTVVGDNVQSSACSSSCDGAVNTSAQQLVSPGKMVFNSAGTVLYVLDWTGGVRQVNFTGSPALPSTISTLTYSSYPSGITAQSDFAVRGGIALDSSGNLYFGALHMSDYHRTVMKRTPAGALTELITNTGVNGSATITSSNSIAYDIKVANNKLYVAYDNKIVRSSLTGTVEAVYNVSGEARSVEVDGSTVYVGLITDGVIKSFTDNAVNATPVTPSLTTFAGSTNQTLAVGSNLASLELTGPRTMMMADGSLYISDMTNTASAIIALDAPAAVAPTISAQPSGASKTVGQSASFTVTAASTDGGTLSYQWKKDGTTIAGATAATYSIGSVGLSDAGNYTVVVTNTLGSSTATVTSSAAALAVSAAATTTTAPATTTTTTTAPTPVSAATGGPSLVTSANQAQLEAAPGAASAVIDGKAVEVQTVRVEATASDADLLKAGKEIVNIIDDLTPAGAANQVKLVVKSDGPVLTNLMTNPDDPTEKLDIPVESVTLVKAGNSAVLISALNQTNLPAEVAPGGAIEVTRGGVMAARAFGLGSSETGEIVLMSTPRLLTTFTVDKNGAYSGQVPLPKNIAFGSHTVVMATKNAKVSLGIKLVRTRMQFRIKRVIGTTLFRNRAGVKKAGGAVTVTAVGRCRATNTRIRMASKPGGCYITVRQAAKGAYKAVYYRFTVSVVKRVIRKKG